MSLDDQSRLQGWEKARSVLGLGKNGLLVRSVPFCMSPEASLGRGVITLHPAPSRQCAHFFTLEPPGSI